MKKLILTISSILLLSQAFATVYYVKTMATGSGSGNSWTNAATVQNAVSWSASGDTLWMAGGMYKASSANAAIINLVGKELAFYGGFNGTETSLSQANWQTNPTILDGDFNGDDNTNYQLGELTRADNSYYLIRYTGDTMLSADVHVEGFTLRNANNTLTGYNGIGGAIQVYGNYALFPVATHTNIVLEDCRFEHNLAASGGAIGAGSTVALARVAAWVDRCSFFENQGQGSFGGGAISALSVNVYQVATVTLGVTNSLFVRNNTVQAGGAISIGTSSTGGQVFGRIANNTFYDNTSTNAPATVDCTNYADSTYYNGVWLVGGADLLFQNNIVRRSTGGVVEIRSKNYGDGDLISNIYNNIIDMTGAQYDGTASNNQNVDPLFMNAGNDDFSLTACSPAINEGDTASLFMIGYNQMTEDISGTNRFNAAVIDLGAYEYQMNLGVTTSGYTLNAAAVNGYIYQWYNCDNGQLISGATSASYTAPQPGSYACIITDNGCVTDTTACSGVALSVAGLETIQVGVYPNPVNDQLNVTFAKHTEATLSVVGIDGRVLQTQDVNGMNSTLNVALLPAGMYILQMTTTVGERFIHKFIKE